MARRIILSMSFLALLCILCSGAVAQTSDQYELAAKRLQHKGEWVLEFGDPETRPDVAISIFDSIIQQYPNSEMVRWAKLKKIECLLYQSKYAQAQIIADDIIIKWPNQTISAWAQWFKGVACLGVMDYLRSYREFRKVVDIYKDLDDKGPAFDARLKFGEIRTRAAELAKTGQNIGDVLTLAADNSQTSLTLGTSILASKEWFGEGDGGDLATAVGSYNLLAAQYPNEKLSLALSALAIGERYLKSYANGKRTVAEDDSALMEQVLSSAVTMAPQDVYIITRAKLNLARFHCLVINNPSQSLEILSSIPQIGMPSDLGPEVLWMMANSQTSARKIKESTDTLSSLVEIWPDCKYCLIARSILAKRKLMNGDIDGAKKITSDIIDKCRDFNAPFEGRNLLIEILHEAGPKSEELAELRKAVAEDELLLQDVAVANSYQWRPVVIETLNSHKARIDELVAGGAK